MQTIKLEVPKQTNEVGIYQSGELVGVIILSPKTSPIIKKFDYTNPVKTKGYWYDAKRKEYQVKSTIGGERKTIGYFKTEEEARTAYQSIKLQEIERKRSAKSI